MIDLGDLMIPKPVNPKKTNKKETTIERCDPLCSEIPEWMQEFREIWWMMKFQYTEILTPVLLMKHLYSPSSRDVRIWRNCEICKRTKITRSHAEDAMAEP